MNGTFWVGLHPSLNEEMLRYVVDTLSEAIQLEQQTLSS